MDEPSEKSIIGKKSRVKGQSFEAKVRQDMEEMGWIVAKWTNTINYEKNGEIGKIVPAKRKYNPFLKSLSIGTGFPDFICFKRKITTEKIDDFEEIDEALVSPLSMIDEEDYDVIGLEVKSNGYLDQTEKGMCIWLLENKIFSRILIARKIPRQGKPEYIDFNVKYNKK